MEGLGGVFKQGKRTRNNQYGASNLCEERGAGY